MPDELTERIIGAAIEVHRVLGPGFLEAVYEEALCTEFDLRGIRYERQKALDVAYKGKVIRGQRLDLLAEDEVIVELKAVAALPDIAVPVLVSYLKAAGLKRRLIINFGVPRLVDGVKRVSV